MAYYLNLVDASTWDTFSRGKRDSFPFKQTQTQYRRLISLRDGDVLLCLLMKTQAWCGVLKVLAPLPVSLAMRRGNNLPELKISVDPAIILPQAQMISVFDPIIWFQLSSTQGKNAGDRSQGWNRRAGLYPDLRKLPPQDGELLSKLLDARSNGMLVGTDAISDPYDPMDMEDARERLRQTVIARRGQKQFRDDLLIAYEFRCAITGCDVLSVLEAAHIRPYLNRNTNHVTNGLLLRADFHTLFDCKLIAIHPETYRVVISPVIRHSEYGLFHNKEIFVPKRGSQRPNKQELQRHIEEAGLLGNEGE